MREDGRNKPTEFWGRLIFASAKFKDPDKGTRITLK
jgi:hypothetical protein